MFPIRSQRIPESRWTEARRLLRTTARSPFASFLVPFLFVLVERVILLPVVPPPQPLVHDEFSNLLEGDTFAHFRLTNSPHPLWQHFETLQELMQPTYMSKYPPAEGFTLAVGQWICGVPWAGVLLSMAIFCGLLPWTFRAWVPATWAFLGALLATFKIGVLNYWTESYWGGGCSAIGGALALGAMLRLIRAPTRAITAVFVLGLGILDLSRPDGALVVVLVFGGFLLWRWFAGGRWKTNWPAVPLRIFPTAIAVALPFLLFIAYYNYRVTGDALTLPYVAYFRQYTVWTALVWQRQPFPEPNYRHEFIRHFWYDWDYGLKLQQHAHFFLTHWQGIQAAADLYFGNVFYPGLLLFIPALCVGRKFRPLFGLLLTFVASSGLICELFPHYTAPVAALIYLVALSALRATWHIAPSGHNVGKAIVLALVAYFLVSTTLQRNDPDSRFYWPAYPPELGQKRDDVLAVLNQQSGRQLVFVRYGPKRNLHDVWTFNAADIDASRIVWVNSMTPAEDRQVLDYYAPQKRTVWLLDENGIVTLNAFGTPKAVPLSPR